MQTHRPCLLRRPATVFRSCENCRVLTLVQPNKQEDDHISGCICEHKVTLGMIERQNHGIPKMSRISRTVILGGERGVLLGLKLRRQRTSLPFVRETLGSIHDGICLLSQRWGLGGVETRGSESQGHSEFQASLRYTDPS